MICGILTFSCTEIHLSAGPAGELIALSPPPSWILRVGQRREGKGRLEGERGGVGEKGGEGKEKGRGRDGTPSKKAGCGPELFDECILYIDAGSFNTAADRLLLHYGDVTLVTLCTYRYVV